MGERLKRGGPHPSGSEREKGKLVGPYPTWDNWKHTIESHLGISLKNLRDSTEVVLREAYTIRRLIQLGENPNTWPEFLKKVDEEYPGLLDKNAEIIRFIVGRTETEEVKSKAGMIRKM